jgi:hypothetical protein
MIALLEKNKLGNSKPDFEMTFCLTEVSASTGTLSGLQNFEHPKV